MRWTADMKCRVCGHVDEARSFEGGTRDEAEAANLTCPNCDEDDGLEVVTETLRRSN